jgi:tRNA modification GTPase
MSSNNTIFALTTLEGKSGLSVFRVSGSRAGDCFSSFGLKERPKPRVATLASLHHPKTSEVIDKGIVLWFPAPASFTGEDVVEFHLHGSRAVIKEMLAALGQIDGYHMAEPGEFSLRAFDNQKMDLTELEGLADLIDAETSMQQRQAIRQMSGELERLYEGWRAAILSILAKVEAYIDFPDEDLPKDLSDHFNEEVKNLISTIEEHLSDRRGEIIRDGFHAVILGAPNAGKSSLLNALAKRDVAIVSEVAGTTRDIIEVHLDIAGYPPVTILDTAGIRENPDMIEKEGIRRALAHADNADIKIVVIDSSATPDAKTLELIDEQTIVIASKSDLTNKNATLELPNTRPIRVSVETGEGLDNLLDIIEAKLSNKITPSTSPTFTRERHRICLTMCSAALSRFLTAIETQTEIELCAEELRLAATELGKITGHINVDEVLGEIFSSFCIGK